MFELLDVKWGAPVFGTPSGTINWSADLSGVPTGSGVTESDLDAALQAAFNAWEAVAAVDFQEVSSGASVSVGSSALGGSIAGIATYGPVFPGLNTINFGQIEFNSDFSWSPNGAGPAVDFYAVALHEIGHIMGLAHVADVSQIMNATIFAGDLGTGDIQGAQYIYGTDPGDTTLNSGGGGGGGGGAMGLVLGLLALIAGLFGLGPGGTVAMAAAGRVPDFDDHDTDGDNALDYLPGIPMDEESALDGDADGHGHPVYVSKVYLAEGVSLPAIDFVGPPNADEFLDDLDDLIA